MSKENNFDKLRSMVHQGLPAEKTEPETEIIEQTESTKEIAELMPKVPEPTVRAIEKRKRKPQIDYQDTFFNRIDFTHRKPLYITANTHRRLMRIVHLMDESKATISSYVENIILHHLETYKDEIDTIYQTNNINPTE